MSKTLCEFGGCRGRYNGWRVCSMRVYNKEERAKGGCTARERRRKRGKALKKSYIREQRSTVEGGCGWKSYCKMFRVLKRRRRLAVYIKTIFFLKKENKWNELDVFAHNQVTRTHGRRPARIFKLEQIKRVDLCDWSYKSHCQHHTDAKG